MKKLTLEELRASYATPAKNENQDFVNNYYNFWDIKPGQQAIIRFLPDLEENPRGFLVEKIIHPLQINGEKKKVPCLGPFKEDCPICKLSQSYYKNEDKINGKRYWKSTSYIAQALIVEDPLPPNADTGETAVGQVKIIALGFQLHGIIKAAFADTGDEALQGVPYDFQEGCDFIIKKTMKGEYADYSLSRFKSKQRALTEDELAVVGDGMIDLSTLLPKNPGLEKVQALLTAEINGETYNDKPGSENEQFEQVAKASASKVVDAPASKAETKPAPAASEAASSDVDDMLAAIRQRRKAAASQAAE